MDILQRFNQIVRSGEGPLTIIELGAYDGYHTGLMVGMIRGTGRPYRYFAFEPGLVVSRLREAVAQLGVTVVNAAIGSTDAISAEWWESDGIQRAAGAGHGQRFNGSSSLRAPTAHNSEAFPEMTFRPGKVSSVRLDTFCEQQSIDVIDWVWADIQGCEIDLIEGGKSALSRTRFLYTEYSDKELYAGQIGLPEILLRLPMFGVVEDYGGDVLLGNREMM